LIKKKPVVGIDITYSRLQLRAFHRLFPHGKLMAPPFYEVERVGGKVPAVVSILTTA
jgi:hypothetical protein